MLLVIEFFCLGAAAFYSNMIACATAWHILQVRLSKIFSWYYPDFGVDKGDRLRFLLPYLPQEPREALQQMLTADPAARGVTMQHKPYDWSINEAGISGEES